MDISIIIPVKNEFVYLSNLVKSIQNQKFDGKIEILVGIDNSKEIIDKIKTSSTLFSNCKFYMFDDNVGPYIIKNTLATLASSNNLFMFDVDDIMNPNLISTSINLLENFHIVKVKYEFFSQTYNYKSKHVNNYSTLAFGAFAIRKSDFLSLNGFQPWFISADIEFIERAKRKIRSGVNNLAIFGKRIHNNSLRKSSEHGVGSDYHNVKNQELSKKRKHNNFENPNTLHTHACKLLDYTNPTKEKFNETHLVFSPEEIFKNLIEGKRVVFIGPATTLENNGIGAFIDSFDVIVRMNSSYMIPAKNQIDYGSRCDILYAGNVFLKLNLLTPDNSQHIKLICSTKNYPVFSGKNRKFSIFRLKNQKRLLTGIYAIEDILNMNPSELHITGIDFYQSEKLYTDFYKIKKLHENEIAKTTINKYHDVEHDLKYFKKNIANKANVTLDEFLRKLIYLDKKSNLFSNQKICIIGSGKITKEINFQNYDRIVGVNQIYKTDMFEKIDTIFHGISISDPFFIQKIPEISKSKKVILVPRIGLKNEKRINDIIRNLSNKCNFLFLPNEIQEVEGKIGSNPLTGIVALHFILKNNPSSIDIFGFDFYEKPYMRGMEIYSNHPTKHNPHRIENDKKFFDELIKNNNINWIK